MKKTLCCSMVKKYPPSNFFHYGGTYAEMASRGICLPARTAGS